MNYSKIFSLDLKSYHIYLALVKNKKYNVSMRISYSKITTFRQCPLKYKWQYIDYIKVPPTPDLFFGSLIHDVLEMALKNDPAVPPVEKLLEYYESKWDSKLFKGDISEKEFREAGIEIIKTFHASHKPGLTTILQTEKFFEIYWEGNTIVGKIDRVDKLPTGELEIIDYKTNKKLPNESDFKFDLQLPLYQWAAETIWNDTDKVKLTLHFLRHNKKLSPQNIKNRKSLQKYILDTIKLIRESDFSPTPSKLCGWCEYLDRCEAGQKILSDSKSNGQKLKANSQFAPDSLFRDLM